MPVVTGKAEPIGDLTFDHKGFFYVNGTGLLVMGHVTTVQVAEQYPGESKIQWTDWAVDLSASIDTKLRISSIPWHVTPSGGGAGLIVSDREVGSVIVTVTVSGPVGTGGGVASSQPTPVTVNPS